jgi:hypothetical protein
MRFGKSAQGGEAYGRACSGMRALARTPVLYAAVLVGALTALCRPSSSHAAAVSEEASRSSGPCYARGHDQPVPRFQQLAGCHPLGRGDVVLRNVEVLLAERGIDLSHETSGSGGIGLARCSPPRSGRDAERICAGTRGGAGIGMRCL